MKIHELIISTIQGEGFHTGKPADFIRLHGCNVGCWFCDTGYSKQDYSGKKIPVLELSFLEILNKLKSNLIVISGGEPMLCPELLPLCELLLKKGYEVAIETSGTSWQEIPDEVWLTLSPKDSVSKLKSIV